MTKSLTISSLYPYGNSASSSNVDKLRLRRRGLLALNLSSYVRCAASKSARCRAASSSKNGTSAALHCRFLRAAARENATGCTDGVTGSGADTGSTAMARRHAAQETCTGVPRCTSLLSAAVRRTLRTPQPMHFAVSGTIPPGCCQGCGVHPHDVTRPRSSDHVDA